MKFLRSKQVTLPGTQDGMDKLLAESFRLLGQLCHKVADLMETQRLAKQGFREQGKFLERVGEPDKKDE